MSARGHARSPRPDLPALNFPEELPVSGKRELIAAAIAEHPVVIVCGETGSGKTTQLPKIAWLAGRGRAGLIGHTQPRRLAATSVAKRIAQELGSPPGQHVGFKIRFNEQISADATIKLMTDGVLLAETQSDPLLRAYDTLIVDEAHERSLNIDFLLGYLKQLLEGPRKGTLKLIITSATIDAKRFAEHFGSPEKPAPVIEVSGRLYPVEVRYSPLGVSPSGGTDDGEPEAETDEIEQNLPVAISDAIEALWRERPGDVLVFLPGEREIRDAMEQLNLWHVKSRAGSVGAKGAIEVLPLFSRLSASDQEKVFSASNGRRIVLATNVAETSLTVPGIRYVIDSGLARMKRYRYRSKVEQLQVENISQAAANQRAGRCGRVSDGICVRLYAQDDFNKRTRFTDPEILRSSLASVILRMRALRLVQIEDFPFIDAPPRRAVLDGYALLTELQALDEKNVLTPMGKQLARLPVDPRIGRMLIAAKDQGSLNDVLIIAAGLSVQDPRERPMQAQQAADQKHLRFTDEKSDFSSLLKVWRYWRQAQQGKESNRLFQEQLKREFLSPRRLREWADVVSQLRDTVKELGFDDKRNNVAAKAPTPSNAILKSPDADSKEPEWSKPIEGAQYEKIHRALLTGLLGNLGLKATEPNQYLGTHEIKFFIHPSSGLAKKGGRWLMAAELVQTHRLYGRLVAQVQPDWIEQAAGHLLKKSCSEARWEKRAAQVSAYERGLLYGLPVYTQRRVHFGPSNPPLARELMIRGALVDQDWDCKLSFFAHNKRLVTEIQALEHKIRRPDILVDADLLYAFFDAKIPENIVTGAGLEHWWREQKNSKLLCLSRDDLMRKSLDGIQSDSFPKQLVFKSISLDLVYHFEPGSSNDGVTAIVPVHLLNQVDAARSEWLVPGMLREKVLVLVKSLPPKIRHRLQPFEPFVDQFLSELTPGYDRNLTDTLRDEIKRVAQLPVLPTDFRTETLPQHCLMRFSVVDEHGRELANSRDLASLRAQYGTVAHQQFKRSAGIEAAQIYQDWRFGPLQDLIELPTVDGKTLIGYPGLVARDTGVELQVFDDPQAAGLAHRKGLLKLFALQFKEQLKILDRNIPGLRDMGVQFMSLGTSDELKTLLIARVLDRACLTELPWPVDQPSFLARANQAKSRLGLLAQEVGRLIGVILSELASLHKKLLLVRLHLAACADVQAQIQRLCPKDFVISVPWEQLVHIPRYLKAAHLRLDKIKADPARDQLRLIELTALQQQWLRSTQQNRGVPNDRLIEFGWLIEELRVSLFAQELKTPVPVSVKRLEKVWHSIEQSI